MSGRPCGRFYAKCPTLPVDFPTVPPAALPQVEGASDMWISKMQYPVLVFAEIFGDAVDRRDAVDLVDMHDQAA